MGNESLLNKDICIELQCNSHLDLSRTKVKLAVTRALTSSKPQIMSAVSLVPRPK